MTKAPVKRSPVLTFLRVVLLPMVVGAILTTAIVFVPRAGWYTNDITTGSNTDYPDLQTRRYDSSPENTLQYAAAAAAGIKGWKVINRDENAGTLRIEAKPPIPFFTDDVTVIVTPIGEANDSSEVVIRSHSRVGKGDLGENARHIRALQKEMDERLPLLR